MNYLTRAILAVISATLLAAQLVPMVTRALGDAAAGISGGTTTGQQYTYNDGGQTDG